MNRPLPTRRLREHPDLDQLRRQAKELLEAYLAGEQHAIAEVNTHYRDADPTKFSLHDAQLTLARAYGFDSWPKLKAYVDGATAGRLEEAVRAGDIEPVRALLEVRPELAHACIDNLQVLHHAVLNRSPEMVRVLMQHGANARVGVYPHRDATSALTLARERGYDEITAIIHEAEQMRRDAKSNLAGAPPLDELLEAIVSDDDRRVAAMIEANPSLVHSSGQEGFGPLHAAAGMLREEIAKRLLDHGADVNRPGRNGLTPLDAAASRLARGGANDRERFDSMARLLRQRGARLTDRAAVALGEVEWLRARHAAGQLEKPMDGVVGGLLRVAVTHDRPETLAVLLDLGLDPDERVRVAGIDEVEYSWGFPLWECAATGKHAMAETLLRRGADPNAEVYASGTPVHQAYGQRDAKMIQLLERYGGVAQAGWAGLYRLTELGKKLLQDAADPRKTAEELLGGGACGGDTEIVRLALARVDWPRDDPRWFGLLEQPLRIWNHGPGHWAHHESDRSTYVECFRLILGRCDPNLRGRATDRGQFGLTILHMVAGSRVEHMTAGERVAFATLLLNAGARLDLRDRLLMSTPLGWACRWGRVELVKLFLERGADPVEVGAEPWATPRAWAQKMRHDDVLTLLQKHGA